MILDPENPVIKKCGLGMMKEGKGNPAEAKALFMIAWLEANTDFEKYIAAHYLARQQETLQEKLDWDEKALYHALREPGYQINEHLPSLYLNIGKCYEDLHVLDKAREHYLLANSFAAFLTTDGYGNMIRSGIDAALKRVR